MPKRKTTKIKPVEDNEGTSKKLVVIFEKSKKTTYTSPNVEPIVPVKQVEPESPKQKLKVITAGELSWDNVGGRELSFSKLEKMDAEHRAEAIRILKKTKRSEMYT